MTKEPATNEYWIALGMIQPEWIYMSHFFGKEEETDEELMPLPIAPEMRIIFHPRLD